MEEKLKIGGIEYTFKVNRKAVSILGKLGQDEENMIDKMYYALLKAKHDMSMEEVSDLLDIAEKEYGLENLMQFATEMVNEVFTPVQEKKYKEIPFLKHKKANK